MADDPELHAFFDRDVFIKLACCDLWNEALTALGVTHPYRLGSAGPNGAKTWLRRKGVSDELQAETLKRLELMMKATPFLPKNWIDAVVGSNIYNKMLAMPGIDTGEAQLALIALNCPVDNRLVTGDKRFIKAMEEGFAHELEELQPRLITFETCLLWICHSTSFETVKDRLIAARSCDGTLKIALGSDNQASAEAFCAGLRSYNPI